MMHIVHSAFRETAYQNQTIESADLQQAGPESAIRFTAYQEVCSKYHEEILAIRKYIPGWEPKFSFE